MWPLELSITDYSKLKQHLPTGKSSFFNPGAAGKHYLVFRELTQVKKVILKTYLTILQKR